MKVIIFFLGLLSFNYIMSFTQGLHDLDTGSYESETQDCEDEDIKYPNENISLTTEFCRSRAINKDEKYRCCFVNSNNGTQGCKAVTYSAFADSKYIKEGIPDNADIHCDGKYLGISLLALLAILF